MLVSLSIGKDWDLFGEILSSPIGMSRITLMLVIIPPFSHNHNFPLIIIEGNPGY